MDRPDELDNLELGAPLAIASYPMIFIALFFCVVF
jgi:hypothetical protein